MLRAPDLVTTPPRHVVAIPAPCHDMQIPVAFLGDAEVLDSPELERLQRPCVDLTAEVDANNCLPGSVVCGHYLWGRCSRHFDQPLYGRTSSVTGCWLEACCSDAAYGGRQLRRTNVECLVPSLWGEHTSCLASKRWNTLALGCV